MAAVSRDTFADFARYYDAVMAPVDYDHWLFVTRSLAGLISIKPFRHLDVACGTCLLIKRLREDGWNSFGVDLSPAMLSTGRRASSRPPVAAADMRALPFAGSFDFITCLFDSVNFLLAIDDVESALRQMHAALDQNGILYFDIVTERMVTDHYENRKWTEDNGGFSTTWSGKYRRKTNVSETTIRVSSGVATIIHQRLYDIAEISRAVESAGFELLAVVDAETWAAPEKETVRVEFVAGKNTDKLFARQFESVRANIEKQSNIDR